MSQETEIGNEKPQLQLLFLLAEGYEQPHLAHDMEALSMLFGKSSDELASILDELKSEDFIECTTVRQELERIIAGQQAKYFGSMLPKNPEEALNYLQSQISWNESQQKTVDGIIQYFQRDGGTIPNNWNSRGQLFIDRTYYFLTSKCAPFVLGLLEFPYQEFIQTAQTTLEQHHAPDWHFAQTLLFALSQEKPDDFLTKDHQEFLRLLNQDRRSRHLDDLEFPVQTGEHISNSTADFQQKMRA